LWLRDTPVTDLAPLARLRALTQVHLSRCVRVRDLAPLAASPGLDYLSLEGIAEQVDLAPFAGRRMTITVERGESPVGFDRLGRGSKIVYL
jgi:hypothetical protein